MGRSFPELTPADPVDEQTSEVRAAGLQVSVSDVLSDARHPTRTTAWRRDQDHDSDSDYDDDQDHDHNHATRGSTRHRSLPSIVLLFGSGIAAARSG